METVKRQIKLPLILTVIFIALSFIPIIQILILTFSGGLISTINKTIGNDNSDNLLFANMIVNLLPSIVLLILFYRSRQNVMKIITAVLAMIFMTAFIFFLTDGIYKDSNPYYLNFIVVALISGSVLAIVSFLRYRHPWHQQLQAWDTQHTTAALKNKGWGICVEQINFIEQQKVKGTDVFQMPLLLKAVKRYLQGMTPHYKHIIAILTILFLTSIMTRTLACTCIGKNKQTTENELGFVDIAVTGKIISVSDYTYYDTVELVLSNTRFDENKWSYMVRHYKRYQLVVDKKFKSAANLPDTIYIVTTLGGGDCGYMFDIGKEYIVYGEGWKEKSIATIQKKRKIKRKLTETKSVDTFYTDICRLTQEKNQKELDNLRRLTEWMPAGNMGFKK
jgi:hypothetical protein